MLVISVASTTDFSPQTTTERVVKRQVEFHADVKLGMFRKKDFCILVLSDGEELHIPHHLLGSDVKSLLTTEKQVTLTTPPRSQDARPNIVSVSKVHGSVLESNAAHWMPALQTNTQQFVSVAHSRLQSVFDALECHLRL